MYLNGLGVPQDYNEALRLFQLAAAQEDANAQNNLGLMYLNGHGVPKDYNEALKLFRLAAAHGCAGTEQSRIYVSKRSWYSEGL